MGKKVAKSTKKFSASGQLKKTIEARRKHQKIKKRVSSKKEGKGKQRAVAEESIDDDEAEEEVKETSKKDKGCAWFGLSLKTLTWWVCSKSRMTVDDFLEGGFMEGSDDDEDMDDESPGSENEDDLELEDDASFASIDDIEEGEEHMIELSKLAEKDPEFFQYLKKNDQELLNFNPDVEDQSDGEEDENMGQTPTLTKAILQKWQKSLLEHRSLRSLRKLLIAFRSAAHMNEENQVLAWSIESSAVYNKLITTAFKYTPVILEHHAPTKTLPNGKFKPPTQTAKLKALQKLVLSYFQNVIHMLSQLTDDDMLQLAVSESAKIIAYIISSRKAVKLYLKKCLDLWSSAADNVRIAAFLAVRKLATSTDESILDSVLKGTYLTLVRSSKNTSVHTLPSINLMKNSASEVFNLDQGVSYQHAFGYIRQLAIHLRNSMKVKSKEAYKQVYNWQYIHCIDFWSIVLARACDASVEAETGKESELKPLIYPLVQVSIGAIKLIPNSRSYPFHLHVLRSLLHLTRHTHTYIPLSPHLVPILISTLTTSSRGSKNSASSTLRPLDLEVQIRAPQQYVKTRVYSDGLVEETSYLLAEWLVSGPVHGSAAFPEIVVPVTVALRKAIKTAKGTKELAVVKGLLDRVEESARWLEQRRQKIHLAPNNMGAVREWERGLLESLEDESPLGKYVKMQRKTRERRRKLVDKARQGEDEILEDDS
ncbi:Noc2-domain-containing protein [Mycena indigotica]|uniref:Noc2-domain-containing protein n=1 Tax=Mycena indigotica TaxID=2126181 RepID=A0A8H6SCY8_9AGAR|nr:Noc2-domain-containing protein [Mycena indigotica]KAF7297154.1 Noc2-domain-containing protein [Mycena indigotica]